ncbi:hypothetical protein Peur_004163 [Populus x canadensis]
MKSLCSFELFSRFAHLSFLTYPSDFQCPQVSSDFPVIFHILCKIFVEKGFYLLSRVIVAHLVLALHYHQGSCRALKILHQPNKIRQDTKFGCIAGVGVIKSYKRYTIR